MVRREEDINFEQEQQQEQLHWRRRAERGRKRLSASVEDVLAERPSNESLEEEESEEAELVRAHEADARSAGLIPPRLSLQSRELAVPSAEGDGTTEPEPPQPGSTLAPLAPESQGSALHEKDEAEKQAANRVLAAFARRFTASLAALGKVRQPGQRPPAPVTAVLPALPAGSETGTSSTTANASASTPSVSGPTPAPSPEQPPMASPHTVTVSAVGSNHESGARPVAGARPSAASPQPREAARPSSQRLAGRTTRVRLEAAPKLAGPPAAPAGPSLTAPPQTTRPLPALGSGYPQARVSARPGPATPPPAPQGSPPSAAASAARPRPDRQEQPAPATAGAPALPFRWQMGKSCFTRGQGEAAVHCPTVGETSVVLVTLTGDPGPVVVQYVSLQPGRGFTVHLSAPTQRETPFHYAVLESAPLSSDVERSQPGNG
ncbi:hypothetical protein [Thermogemmatispora carboxidivorans]|uniref:hypothetical protein n=1 Tax=Thermogemmatispora carboxidivorans TaxID=1382306 RepID=UPI00069CB3DE|nr:hypothetical protein [Thermogemmatispora carboxidivorans]